jgi:D-psicose/D-tagatose/L-ribulose 3-epimerase
MRIPDLALCNEVIAGLPFADQCRLAAALGYAGLEVAPFTLAEDPLTVPAAQRAGLRRIAADHGLRITGLHWLLTSPGALSITAPDATVRERTLRHMLGLVDLCADLGGVVMVHGSPAQRQLGGDPAAPARAEACLRPVADAAHAAGIAYCLEPLARSLTDYVNTIDEALAVIARVGSPGLVTMLDSSAAWEAEADPPEVLLSRHLPQGLLRHVHLNDVNRRAPGQGDCRFGPIARALIATGYAGTVSVEPFDYQPDGPTAAAVAAGYLRGVFEGAAGEG